MQLHTCEYRSPSFPNPVICAFMQPIADRLGSGHNPYHQKNLAKKIFFVSLKLLKDGGGGGGERECISASGSCIRVCIHKAYYLFAHASHRPYQELLLSQTTHPRSLS